MQRTQPQPQFQQQTMLPHQQQQAAALQAAMMNPAALQAIIQSQNPQLLHQIQHQQLQQLQQLHQQNLRLAAAFNQNQMGIYNATSALLNQMPPKQQQQHQQQQQQQFHPQSRSPNLDFENFPTREDYSPSPPLFVAPSPKCPKAAKSKEQNKDSAFDDISDDSSESTGSSYTNAELESHEIPDDATLDQICKQVEEYLSDEYLSTDKYLLRQLRSKSEGYLSVKLLTSFKKIKKLTRDWRVTAHALKRSSIVELSADGHRVKRHAHLPDNLRRGRTMTSILAIRVPEDWATLEAITNLFSTYGNITLARVLRPGRPIPPDLRNYATQIPDMGATTCAVVDFDSTDSAHECCRGLRDKNLRGMRIALLGPRIRRTLYKAEKKKVPENRHQRRSVASSEQPNAVGGCVSPSRKNVTKEEGLKIIQSYFNGQQVKPDDPLDFPPLGAKQQETQPSTTGDALAAQMKKMVLDHKKPTMSEIVKSGDSELLSSSTVEVVESLPSSHSPKPIGPAKTWNSASGDDSHQDKDDDLDPEVESMWSPCWSFNKQQRKQSIDDGLMMDDEAFEAPGNAGVKLPQAPLKFESLPSMGTGIWGATTTTTDSGW